MCPFRSDDTTYSIHDSCGNERLDDDVAVDHARGDSPRMNGLNDSTRSWSNATVLSFRRDKVRSVCKLPVANALSRGSNRSTDHSCRATFRRAPSG